MAHILPQMNRQMIINRLVEQVNMHPFRRLWGAQRNGPAHEGWGGGLSIYALNGAGPDPAGHFAWLSEIRQRINGANTDAARVDIANEILDWGGMRTRIEINENGQALLNAVIQSAVQGHRVNDAPMNSSYTKIAALFGYDHRHNTIWDSRVSTAVCFRLACIFDAEGSSPEDARRLFPKLGYVSGVSHRVTQRLPLVCRYFPNVYAQWHGHFAGAELIAQIAEVLNAKSIPCPAIENDPDPQKWTPWKVNMVFFMDDITECPGLTGECVAGAAGKPPKEPGKTCASGFASEPPFNGPCGHKIVNHIAGIHFEPDCIEGELNDAIRLNLAHGHHGLNEYRFLLEFYRLPYKGKCKISGRVRTNDPAFRALLAAARAAGCPEPERGIRYDGETCSIFIYPLRQVPQGAEDQAIIDFTCNPPKSYTAFLEELSNILDNNR